MSEPPAPRIGHAERDRTVERLREAAGLGRIDLDELDERVEAALTARTQPELHALLADLGPTGPTAVGGIAVRGPAPVVPAASGYAAADPMVLSAGSGTTRKSGGGPCPASSSSAPVSAASSSTAARPLPSFPSSTSRSCRRRAAS